MDIDVDALERRAMEWAARPSAPGMYDKEADELMADAITALRQFNAEAMRLGAEAGVEIARLQEALKEGDESLQMTANALREAEEALKESEKVYPSNQALRDEVARLREAIEKCRVHTNPQIMLEILGEALEPALKAAGRCRND